MHQLALKRGGEFGVTFALSAVILLAGLRRRGAPRNQGGETVSLWRLTWRERVRVLFTGRVWVRQLNFGQPLQPQKLSVMSPFLPEPAYSPEPETFGATGPSR